MGGEGGGQGVGSGVGSEGRGDGEAGVARGGREQGFATSERQRVPPARARIACPSRRTSGSPRTDRAAPGSGSGPASGRGAADRRAVESDWAARAWQGPHQGVLDLSSRGHQGLIGERSGGHQGGIKKAFLLCEAWARVRVRIRVSVPARRGLGCTPPTRRSPRAALSRVTRRSDRRADGHAPGWKYSRRSPYLQVQVQVQVGAGVGIGVVARVRAGKRALRAVLCDGVLPRPLPQRRLGLGS